MDVSPLGGSCRPMWSLCWPVLEELHQQELSGDLCSSPGGYRKHLDTAEHDMVHRQGTQTGYTDRVHRQGTQTWYTDRVHRQGTQTGYTDRVTPLLTMSGGDTDVRLLGV